ncbi:unnamed protein product [Darwinula stevensoni]|uniref:Protein kinase domain-containing protein n=1 Tax=Darwinula stevensoni TaxID=69355 RepID=A0A7R9FQ45_9CRUS|nr:unnamed protein product [Darwinula stevensoni]CAG0898994.1 unnamed protein product [Darwinula stevensoni]
MTILGTEYWEARNPSCFIDDLRRDSQNHIPLIEKIRRTGALMEFKIYNNTRDLKLSAGILGELTLQSIWIGDTNVTSIQPSFILPSKDRLKDFTLQNSHLEEFPFHIIPRLRSLNKLWLRNNSLTSIPSLQSLSLEILDFNYNKINTIDVDGWMTPNLREFDIGHNPLSSFPSAVVKGLEKLEEFYCSGCNLGPTLLRGQLEFRSKTLKKMSLLDNNISRLEPEAIAGILGKLTLQSLWIGDTNVTSIQPSFILPSKDRLKDFTLQNSHLEEFPFHIIPRLRSLKKLWLRNNSLTSVPSLQSLSLERLDFNYNKINTIDVDGWMTPNLREFDIGHNPLSSFPSAVVKGLEKLEEFYCSGCNLGPTLLRGQLEFRSKTLKKMSLLDNNISRLEPEAIAGVNSDTTVHLTRNNITILEENAFRPILEIMSLGDGLLYLYDNPIHCDCTLDWLTLTPALMKKLEGTCANGTALRQLHLAELRRTCCRYPNTCVNDKLIVHRNLAARNILLAEENVVKISDFGFARDIHVNNQYVKKGDGPVPYKWMALESLIHEKVYTSKSDVWAYGITLWEIFSLGKTPYQGMTFGELIQRLQAGYRMEAPDYASEPIYQIMRKCWYADPNDRPTFSVLSAWLATKMPESEHQIVHRNLATRNILLAEENVVKISDFGFARDIQINNQVQYLTNINNQYVKKGDGPVPYKWMALESLIHEKVYTSKSDVWAYGITLWEIFSLGKTPYQGMTFGELIQRLQAGYRMEAPDYASEPILRILELNKPYEEMNAEHFKTHPDYLQLMAPGEFEEGCLQPRGILDLQSESSESSPGNTIHEYSEIGQVGYEPPKIIPPRKVSQSMQSQYVEDPSDWMSTQNIIAEFFPESDRHGKFFVEAGALDGQTLSKTLYLEKKYGWTGLLVEPNPHLFKKLSEMRRNAWLSPHCLSPKDEVIHRGRYVPGITP